MRPFEKCPVCNGEIIEKEVEKLLWGGIHTAIISVHAEVCLHCGERLYSYETVRQIRNKLKRQEVSEFELLGKSFRVNPSAGYGNHQKTASGSTYTCQGGNK